jgi:hypothetical protein
MPKRYVATSRVALVAPSLPAGTVSEFARLQMAPSAAELRYVADRVAAELRFPRASVRAALSAAAIPSVWVYGFTGKSPSVPNIQLSISWPTATGARAVAALAALQFAAERDRAAANIPGLPAPAVLSSPKIAAISYASPHVWRDAVIALVAGAVLALALIVVRRAEWRLGV